MWRVMLKRFLRIIFSLGVPDIRLYAGRISFRRYYLISFSAAFLACSLQNLVYSGVPSFISKKAAWLSTHFITILDCMRTRMATSFSCLEIGGG